MQQPKPTANSSAPSSTYHIPVLYRESLEALQIKPAGVYVDCTFGGGGHSRGILEQLGPEGKLIAFDQDADAQRNLPEDARVLFVPQNFRHIQRFLRLYKVREVDGVLAIWVLAVISLMKARAVSLHALMVRSICAWINARKSVLQTL